MATNDHDLETEQQAVEIMMHHLPEVVVDNSVRFGAIVSPPVHEVVARHNVPRRLLLVRWDDLLCEDFHYFDLGRHFGRALKENLTLTAWRTMLPERRTMVGARGWSSWLLQ